MVSNVSELITELRAYEMTMERARRAGAKVQRAPVKGTLDDFYARAATRIQGEAHKILSDAVLSPGYAQLKAVCMAEFGMFTAQRLEQMHGRLSIAKGLDPSVVFQMSLKQFANEYLRHAASPDVAKLAKVEESQPLLQVEKWSELAIGVQTKRLFWAMKPVPEVGQGIALSDAVKLALGGKQWPALLELLAQSADGCSAPRHAVIKAFGYLAPLPTVPKEGRARPKAIEEQLIIEDLPTKANQALSQLNRSLATLGRKLRCYIAGPTRNRGTALFVDGDLVRSGFVVRYLFPDDSGHYNFGERPSGMAGHTHP